MKVWAITFGGQIDRQKTFIRKEDCESCLAYILDGTAYDRVPDIIELDVNEYYNNDIWHEKWGFTVSTKG